MQSTIKIITGIVLLLFATTLFAAPPRLLILKDCGKPVIYIGAADTPKGRLVSIASIVHLMHKPEDSNSKHLLSIMRAVEKRNISTWNLEKITGRKCALSIYESS